MSPNWIHGALHHGGRVELGIPGCKDTTSKSPTPIQPLNLVPNLRSTFTIEPPTLAQDHSTRLILVS